MSGESSTKDKAAADAAEESSAEVESAEDLPEGEQSGEPSGEPAADSQGSGEAPEDGGAEAETQSEGSGEDAAAKEEPDWKDMYARTLADFDNYRKRAVRDREELVKFATSDAVKDMLPTADNLALALEQAKDKADDPFVKGVQLAYDGFLKALKDHGAEPFASVGEVLDPNRHEAIATLPSDTVEEGRISTEVKTGWMINGRLLRAAQVVVSSGKGDR